MSTTRTMLALTATATLVLTSVAAAAAPDDTEAPTTGRGTVFKVNPVQSSGDQTLTDDKDSATAVPRSEYAEGMPLRNLDGSGYLSGSWVVVGSSTGAPAYSDTSNYDYDRSQDQFEQVMGYFWINQAQEYLQSLGFGGDLPGVMDEPLDLRINQYGGDNSFQTTKPFRITLGKGGVDDAEDAEVIVHEYGHAVHADQVPGFGEGLDAGAIGEGFSDYLGVSVGLDAAQQYGWPVRAAHPYEAERGWDPRACVADWDATSYSASPVKCLRRMDQNFTLATRFNQVHRDGMIWSRALWDIRNGYERLRSGVRGWDTTLIASQFDYAADTSFQAAAKATYEKALARDGSRAAKLVKDAFADRGITF